MDGAAGRGISLPVSSSQASRKEWRVISEQSLRNSTSEEIDRSNLGQSDERSVYEVQQGRESADVDFRSISIHGNLDNDLLQQRLHTVKKQREELQHMEIELRAQIITRSEIMELQKVFDAEVKEQANAGMKLQEQLCELDQKICELERRMEEKERELQAIRLDNEAAWAKEGLLREQNKELQTYRQERDNSEAERVQNIKQIHELQEHIQEKERQFMELQEQNRIAKETIIYNDEQMREAHAWMSRAQEIEALQQAELCERAEQYNQLWLACQRQFGEMERLHLHIQQLEIELTDARERNGTSKDCSQVSNKTSKDTSQYELKNESKLNENSNSLSSRTANPGNVPNGNAKTALSLTSVGNVSTQSDLHGVALQLSSLHGMPTFIQPGPVTALHPFLVHQQGVTTVPSQIPHHLGHFQPVPIPSLQHWTNQQVSSEGGSQISGHTENHLQMESTLLRPESSNGHDASINGTLPHPEITPKASVGVSCEVGQQAVPQSVGEIGIPSLALQTISPQFHDALNIGPLEHSNKLQGKNSNNHGVKAEGLITGEVSSSTYKSSAEVSAQPSHSIDKVKDVLYNDAAVVPVRLICTSQNNAHACTGKATEPDLLEEQALLACIVRTIPPGPGGRIRISTTLPNRLEKMLSPLHWLDCQKKFGKLDEFVASHPELFVIDGDYIQLREGAQEIIAATSAAARVAAAAAAAATSSSHPSHLPSVVAVTPMAQSQRLKKSSGNVENAADNICYEFMAMQNQHSPPNVVAGGIIPKMKVSMKPKNAPRDAPRVQFSMSDTNLVGKKQERDAVRAQTCVKTVKFLES